MTGKPCLEREYDLGLSGKLREVVREYEIKYDPDTPVLSDDSLADDIFEAALDFTVKWVHTAQMQEGYK